MRTKAGMIVCVRMKCAWCACTAAAIFVQMANIARVIIEFGRNSSPSLPLQQQHQHALSAFFFIYFDAHSSSDSSTTIATRTIWGEKILPWIKTVQKTNRWTDSAENILCVCIRFLCLSWFHLHFILTFCKSISNASRKNQLQQQQKTKIRYNVLILCSNDFTREKSDKLLFFSSRARTHTYYVDKTSMGLCILCCFLPFPSPTHTYK